MLEPEACCRCDVTVQVISVEELFAPAGVDFDDLAFSSVKFALRQLEAMSNQRFDDSSTFMPVVLEDVEKLDPNCSTPARLVSVIPFITSSGL